MSMRIYLRAAALVFLSTSMAFAQAANQSVRTEIDAVVDGGSAEGTTNQETREKLKELIVQAQADGRPDEFIFNLIDQAAASETLRIPDAMKTTGGTIDYVYFLASLFPDQAAELAGNSVALTESTNDVEPEPAALTAERAYVVQTGDSLAAIAQRFYGDSEQFMRVFIANRDQISLPSQIFVGQRLLIP